MDGSRRTFDINLYLNNNNTITYDESHVVITNNNYVTNNNNTITYNENHVVITNNNYMTNNNNTITYDENHVVITNNNYVTNNTTTNNNGNNNGHTFMSPLLQPSPLRTTPDMQVNIRHPGPANFHISTPGFELQYSNDDYMPPHAAGPYAGHVHVPYGNDPRINPMGPHHHYNEQQPPVMSPVDVDMEDVFPSPYNSAPQSPQEASDDTNDAEDPEEENPSDLEIIFYNLQDWTYDALTVLQEIVGVNTGLTEEEIEVVLRKYKFKQRLSDGTHDDSCCPICLDDYKDKDDLGSLNCSHNFHLECIKQWLLKKSTCPLCREIA